MTQDTQEQDWPYDAVQGHWLTEKHRLPVVGSPYPRWRYHVAVVVSEGPWPAIEPTEAEAAVLGSYLQFWISKWYNERWVEKMRERPFDIDSGTVTRSFLKRPDGTWCYRQCTWSIGPMLWPSFNSETQYHDVVDLIDHIENLVPEKWGKWKAEHPDVFAVEATR